MTVLVGIDEAGFGPILGPLTVSCIAFRLPRDLLGADMWHVLEDSVGRERKRLAGRLLIADSKKAFDRSRGLTHLARTVFAALGCIEKQPANLYDLLDILCPHCLARIKNYPWYQHLRDVSLTEIAGDISIPASVFRKDMKKHGITLIGLGSDCLDVGHYNRLVTNVGNKSSILFTSICSLIQDLYDRFGDDDLQVIVDRQGGRKKYGRILMRMFPSAKLTVIRQTDQISSYELNFDHRSMRLHFAVDADDRYLPVSLASMVSKLLRELLIGRINEHFCRQCADLKPTAGYWQDGLRFISDLENASVTFEKNRLIRCR